MSPEAVGILDRLGVLETVDLAPHRKLRGILIHSYDGSRSRGTYRPVGPYRPSRPYGIAIRRRIFDEILFRNAASFPSVTALEGFRVDDLLIEDGRVVGVTGPRGSYHAALVVGADGVRSVVARRLGLSEPAQDHQRFALSAYFTDVPHEDYGELHLGFPGYFALAPVDANLVHLNFVVDRGSIEEARGDAEGYFLRHANANPRLEARLRRAERVGPVRATGPMARRCRGTIAPGAMLVGDAAEFVDPFTGEGIYIALRSAELAAATIADGAPPERYERARDDEFREKFRMCWMVQKYLGRPKLANFIVRRLAQSPELADRITAVTGDYAPPELVSTFSFYLELLNPFGGRKVTHAVG
jgi:flavin-dependent dehydrogenase